MYAMLHICTHEVHELGSIQGLGELKGELTSEKLRTTIVSRPRLLFNISHLTEIGKGWM